MLSLYKIHAAQLHSPYINAHICVQFGRESAAAHTHILFWPEKSCSPRYLQSFFLFWIFIWRLIARTHLVLMFFCVFERRART